MVKIKDIPELERPRERLINEGVNNLNNEELLSIILKTGTKNISVKELSNHILKELDSFKDLKDINLEKLKSIKGIGNSKACYLLASIELGKRLNRKYESINEVNIKKAEDIFNYFKDKIGDIYQEEFYCIYLNNKNKVIEDKLLYIGTINQSLVNPREIFKEAYLINACSIIIIHNHPAGNPEPSNNDIELTKQLSSVGNLLGIRLLDHIIIGNNYYSFIEHGLI